MSDANWSKIIGESLILAAIQTSLGSIELSSKYSVMNFSKDQDTLNGAMVALREYCLIAILWMVGTCAVLYSQFGWKGFVTGFVANNAVLVWIIISYMKCFKKAAIKYGLKEPKFWDTYT
jgi:hypothetical protein